MNNFKIASRQTLRVSLLFYYSKYKQILITKPSCKSGGNLQILGLLYIEEYKGSKQQKKTKLKQKTDHQNFCQHTLIKIITWYQQNLRLKSPTDTRRTKKSVPAQHLCWLYLNFASIIMIFFIFILTFTFNADQYSYKQLVALECFESILINGPRNWQILSQLCFFILNSLKTVKRITLGKI